MTAKLKRRFFREKIRIFSESDTVNPAERRMHGFRFFRGKMVPEKRA
jgi:hypothetical protein